MVVKCLQCDWVIPFAGECTPTGFTPDEETAKFMMAHTLIEHEGEGNYLVKHDDTKRDLRAQLRWMADVQELNRMYDLADPRVTDAELS